MDNFKTKSRAEISAEFALEKNLEILFEKDIALPKELVIPINFDYRFAKRPQDIRITELDAENRFTTDSLKDSSIEKSEGGAFSSQKIETQEKEELVSPKEFIKEIIRVQEVISNPLIERKLVSKLSEVKKSVEFAKTHMDKTKESAKTSIQLLEQGAMADLESMKEKSKPMLIVDDRGMTPMSQIFNMTGNASSKRNPFSNMVYNKNSDLNHEEMKFIYNRNK